MRFKEPLLACLVHDIGPLSCAGGLACKSLREQVVFPRLFQGWEDIEGAFTERLQLAETKYPLHSRIPHCIATLAVKREDAVWAAIYQPFIDGSQFGVGSE